MRPVIEALFQPGWKHKRIGFELTEAGASRQRAAKGAWHLVQPGERKRNNPPTINKRSLNDR